MAWKPRPVFIFVALSLAINLLYAWVTPHYEVLDEYRHYPVVQYMTENGLALPPQDPQNPGIWVQEGSQPPIYYMLAALLTAWIDQTDMDVVRHENPFVRFDMYPPDLSTLNLTVNNPDAALNGTFLATRIIRILSAFLGALTVAVTYYTARALFPERPLIFYGAPAFNAVLPMFAFISGSVNNDNFSNLSGNLIILILIRMLLSDSLPRWRDYVFLGLCVGFGLLSKLSIGFTVPLVALVLLGLAAHRRDWRPIMGAVISGGLTIAIAGWWYLRNWHLYGDPTGLAMFTQMSGERIVPIGVLDVLSELPGFNYTFWGTFGAITVPTGEGFYIAVTVVSIIGVIGAILWWAFHLATPALRDKWPAKRWLAAGLSGAWILITLLACLRWTLITPASQGRLAFIALSSISVWFIIGLTWFLPRRAAKTVVIGWVAALGVAAFTIPFAVIAPVYALPEQTTTSETIATWHEQDGGTGEVSLMRITPPPSLGTPGSFVTLATALMIDAPLSRDYALFLHAIDPDGTIVAQREVYPGRGLLLTSHLDAEQTWENPISLWLPPSLHTPIIIEFRMGWFDPETGQRLVLTGGKETLSLGRTEIPPHKSEDGIPNPIDVSFGPSIRLIGYSVSSLGIKPGGTVEVELYWKAIAPITEDYTVTLQIIDPVTAAKSASRDSQPLDGTRPTSTWQVGENLIEKIVLNIAPDALPDMAELRIGLYTQDENGEFIALAARPGYTPSYLLTPMRVVMP